MHGKQGQRKNTSKANTNEMLNNKVNSLKRDNAAFSPDSIDMDDVTARFNANSGRQNGY